MSIFELWLIFSVIPAISTVSDILTFLSAIMVGVACVALVGGSADDDENWIAVGKKLMKIAAPVFLLSIILSIITPSREDLKYIIGGYVVTNAESISELPDNIVKYANKFLKEELEEKKK